MANRSFWRSLVFTTKGDLDLSWILTTLVCMVGVIGFLFEMISGHRASVLGWSFLGTTFLSVLIAAVPISKARLLADSKTIETLDSEFIKVPQGKAGDADIG